MLATIDDDTAQKLERDRREHGHGYLRVGRDGRIEHVPYDATQPIAIMTAPQVRASTPAGDPEA